MYLYFLNDIAEALNAFKIYKVEVEKQKEKKIKIVRSDRGGEYYGRYTENGQMIGPFAQFLEEKRHFCSIHNAWHTTTKWCSRKKKSHTYGHGKEHAQ
jgi:hypothetical protein